MRKEYKKTYKRKMVEKYKKSNMKISEFCKINEIPVSTFNRWVLENKINSKCVSNFGEIDTKSLNNIEANTNKITEVTEIKLILPNILHNILLNHQLGIHQNLGRDLGVCIEQITRRTCNVR